jgi:hypothetical protein
VSLRTHFLPWTRQRQHWSAQIPGLALQTSVTYRSKRSRFQILWLRDIMTSLSIPTTLESCFLACVKPSPPSAKLHFSDILRDPVRHKSIQRKISFIR